MRYHGSSAVKVRVWPSARWRGQLEPGVFRVRTQKKLTTSLLIAPVGTFRVNLAGKIRLMMN
jgi:hypothetical protein